MRLVITIEFDRGAREDSGHHESSTDALLERVDPHQAPIGFVPARPDASGDYRQEQ